ncbi:MAG: hypothetical protein ABF470_11055 [Liquorilactobacillus sp.]|uniref:hypothetical protein n=1 Tax=Liquorilactobacillus sp. TaxID=2767923 RepID=UPI0039E95227
MGNFTKYSRVLVKSSISFVILLVLAQLIIPISWKLLLDYYLISNFLLLNPFNIMNIGLKGEAQVVDDTMSRTKRTVKEAEEIEGTEAAEQMLQRSKRKTVKENDTQIFY